MSTIPPLSLEHPSVQIPCGDLVLLYRLHPADGKAEFSFLPASRLADRVENRDNAPLFPFNAVSEGDVPLEFRGDNRSDPLLHLHLRGEALALGFASGRSMRHSASTHALSLIDQTIEDSDASIRVLTRLGHPSGIVAFHEILWTRGRPGMRCQCWLENQGEDAQVIEHLSSFAINGLTPFAEDDAPKRLALHRLRAAWSLEGRLERRSFEELHLERSWAGYSHNLLRFGQCGSMPVREFFPFVALEDSEAGVVWGAELVGHGSWQMEVHRREDPVSLAGSHADYDFGQWSKTLKPGERFDAPAAYLSAVDGDVEELLQDLIQSRAELDYPEPESEDHMPIVFNEWCSSWGNPTLEGVTETANILRDMPVEIFVIDDGWAQRPPEANFQSNGDWIVDTDKFPGGLAPAAAAISAAGLTPGIWFEFEVINEGNPAFELCEHQLRRHGRTLQVGGRHFWDFRDPWTFEFLREKVIHQLRDNGFTYMKVDYNDSIGIGCDPLGDDEAGLGEGLRQHLEKVREFFLEVRAAIPGFRLESCSSGGHRLEPGMIGLGSMSSFSDAHECLEIPIIGANVLRMMPARKNQIWVVLRPQDSRDRLIYGLCATFMGRMAISGDLVSLNETQKAVLDEGLDFYREVHEVIRDGELRLFQQELGPSYRYPEGRQAVRFVDLSSGRLLLVCHSFHDTPQSAQSIPLPEGRWKLKRSFGDGELLLQDDGIKLSGMQDFQGSAFLLEREL